MEKGDKGCLLHFLNIVAQIGDIQLEPRSQNYHFKINLLFDIHSL